jgi:hypothetical protein
LDEGKRTRSGQDGKKKKKKEKKIKKMEKLHINQHTRLQHNAKIQVVPPTHISSFIITMPPG